MRKLVFATMMTAMLLCVAGCGNKKEEKTAETGNNAVTATAAPTAVNEGEFKTGSYAGNAAYSSGEFSMTWNFVVTFQEDGSFTIVNAAEEEKGAGTYALTEQCYTMTYSDGRTGTFVVQKDGTLEVTAELPYGQASIDPAMVGGIVLNYSGEAAADMEASEQGSREETVENNENKEAEVTEEVNYTIGAGTYAASYTKESPMAGTVVYNYSATVSEDGRFSYNVSFAMADTTYDGAAANGTYVLEGNKFVFTDSEGAVTEGTLTAEDTLVISLMASAMAKEPYEVTFTLAQ